MVRDWRYKLVEDFIKKPDLSNWLFYGTPGLGKSTLAAIMAKAIVPDSIHIWHLVGSEISSKQLKEISEGICYRPTGLFHAVIIEEVDEIPPACRASFKKLLDPKGIQGKKNTCWFFTTNADIEEMLDLAFLTRHHRILFTKEGMKKPTTELLMKIADLEGFVLTQKDADKIVEVSANNIRESISELERRCRTDRVPQKAQPLTVLGKAA